MSETKWTFLSNHAHVYLQLARNPDIKLVEAATAVGITLRSVQGIVNDLEKDGYITVTKNGRRNRYAIIPEAHFRHPLEAHLEVRALVTIFEQDDDSLPVRES